MGKFSLVGALLALVLVGCSGGSSDSNAAPSPDKGAAAAKKRRIAFIPKGATHEFWKTMQAGAEKAAGEKNVELLWKAPMTEADRAEQIKVVENFTNEKVDGIVLAPLDAKAITAPAQEAAKAGIPVLIVDSAIEGMEPISFIATDNFAAGQTCAENLAKTLGGKGKVIVLRYQEGSASTMAREEGFLAKAKELGLEIVSSEQYAGATRETAQSASENLLQRFKAGDGLSAQGIFCPNESATFGMMRALENAKLFGKVKLVGFDSSQELLDAVKAGNIEGLLLQNPFKMGYLAVTKMVESLEGKKPEAKIDSGAVFVNKNNLESPEAKEVLPK